MEQSNGVVRHRWGDCSCGNLRIVVEEETLWRAFCFRCGDTGDSVYPSPVANIVHDSEFRSRSVPAASVAALLYFMDLSTASSPLCVSAVPQFCGHLHRIRNFSWRAYAYSVDFGVLGAYSANSCAQGIFHSCRFGLRHITCIVLFWLYLS